MPVKVTYGFAANNTGDRRYTIAESVWLPGSNALDGTADDATFRLVNARLGVCAGNIFLVSIRQSLFTLAANGRPVASRQRNRILSPGSLVNVGRTVGSTSLNSTGGFVQLNSDQPKASVLCFLDGRIQPGGAYGVSNHYLAGIPDDIIQTGAQGTPAVSAVAGWLPAFQVWLTQLQAGGFAFLGNLNPPTGGVINITRWANEAAGSFRLMFTVPANSFTLGQVVHIRGVRMALPRTPTPAGKWKIDAVAGPDAGGNYTYTLKNSQGFSASNIITDGTVESVGYAFYSFSGTGTPMRATTRKRGGRYGASVGRSRPRQRQLV